MSHLFLQKDGLHKSANLLTDFQKYADSGYFPSEDLTPFANCARNLERGVDYSEHPDVHEAYRMYMNDRWKENNITLTWRWGREPEWRNEYG
jgi:acyl carrier protein phosphodiesterase